MPRLYHPVLDVEVDVDVAKARVLALSGWVDVDASDVDEPDVDDTADYDED